MLSCLMHEFSVNHSETGNVTAGSNFLRIRSVIFILSRNYELHDKLHNNSCVLKLYLVQPSIYSLGQFMGNFKTPVFVGCFS